MKSLRLADFFSKIQDYLAEEFGYEVERWQVIAVVVLCLLILAGSSILYLRSRFEGKAKVRQIKEQPAGKSKEGKILVYVCGAVQKSGVYRLVQGTRVVDAISAAGGPVADADLTRLNLAKPVSDGEKIYVLRAGESGGGEQVSKDSSSEKINLNTASAEELDKLPGIGKALAERIVTYRESHGKFKNIEELQEVEGIGPKKFTDLKNLVTI